MTEKQPSDQPKIKLGDMFAAGRAVGVSSASEAQDEQVAQLQSRIADAENRLYEERFLWILVATVVFDAYIFANIDNWAGAIVLGILELIGLVVLAQKCRVDPIMPLLDKVGAYWSGTK